MPAIEEQVHQNKEDIAVIKVQLKDIKSDTEKILDSLNNGIKGNIAKICTKIDVLTEQLDDEKKRTAALSEKVAHLEIVCESLAGRKKWVDRVIVALISSFCGGIVAWWLKLKGN